MIRRQCQTRTHGHRHTNSVAVREQERVQENIHRISMVVRRLLEVDTIGVHLARQFALEDSPSDAPPLRCTAEFRKQQPEIQQAERLTCQMCVGAEVCGQVALQMPAMHVQVFQHPLDNARRQGRRTPKKFNCPQPRDRAIRNLQTARPVDAILGRVGIHP